MNASIYRWTFGVSSFALIAGHFTSRTVGWYGNTFWADLFLHFVAGIVITAGLVLFLGRGECRKRIGSPSSLFIFFFLVLSAGFFSFLWEVYEFSMYQIFPEYMQYSTALSDALSDIASGTLGGVIFGLVYFLRERK